MVLRNSDSDVTGTRRTTQRSSLESLIFRRLMSQSGTGEPSSCNNPEKESLPCSVAFCSGDGSWERSIFNPGSSRS